MDTFFRNNFGGVVMGLIVVIAAYSAVSIWEPKYASAFAVVTLVGIGMFWLNAKANNPTPPGSQPQQHGNY